MEYNAPEKIAGPARATVSPWEPVHTVQVLEGWFRERR
jgi:hypothetical protein